MNNKFKDEIIIQYIINNNDTTIKLFGKNFIKNNKDNFKMIIQRNKYEIKEKIDFNNILTNNNISEIKLKGIQNINNMKDLFSSCYYLNSLLDISK